MADGLGQKKKGLLLFATVLLLSICTADDVEKQNTCKHVPNKKIDTARLTINTEGVRDRNITLKLLTITTECYTCKLQPVAEIPVSRNSCTILVDTRWKMKVAIDGGNTTSTNCSEENLSEWFKDQGDYTIYLTNINGNISCGKPLLVNDPMDSNIPIYVAIGAFAFLTILWYGAKKLHREHVWRRLQTCCNRDAANYVDPALSKGKSEKKMREKSPDTVRQYNLRRRKKPMPNPSLTSKGEFVAEQDLGVPTNMAEDDVQRPRSERLKSLDTFRGISIIVMIFVNYRGGDYWFFRHSKWNGLTVADLVFPWFVWIMGTAMAFSFKAQLRRATPKSKMFWKIFKRSVILFALGLLINSSDGLNPVRMRYFRIPGVLQRFAGTYLIIATLHMMVAKPNDPNQYAWWSPIRDITDYWKEWIVNIILVVLWLFLTFSLPVPGCPKGYLGPGGLALDSHTNVSLCTGGAASYIDRKIFGVHMYQHPTCKEVYHTSVAHDPEGLLGTLTSCLMCFLGLQAGKIMRMFPDWKLRVRRFLVWGLVLGVIAVILCKGTKNDGFIPINKNLWSLSFVICLSSFAFFLFAFCYVTIDVYKVWSGAPFYYPGMNSIFMYVAHLVLLPYFPVSFYVDETSHWAQLAMNIWGPSFWCLVTYKMYRDKFFITI